MLIRIRPVTGKKKKTKSKSQSVVPLQNGEFPYHPEEEFLDSVRRPSAPHTDASGIDDMQVATLVHTYPFKSAPPRDEDAFGVEQFGRLVLLEGGKLRQAVEAMEEACR